MTPRFWTSEDWKIYIEKEITKISEIPESKCLYSVVIISHGLLVYD